MIRRTLPPITVQTELQDGGSPEAENAPLLTRCWILGEKYGLATFQDCIMLALVQSLYYCKTDLTVVKEAFEGTPNRSPCSPLRRLMAEEAVHLVATVNVPEDRVPDGFLALDALDGVVGFTSAFALAFDAYKASDGLPDRFDDSETGEGPQLWADYRVVADEN